MERGRTYSVTLNKNRRPIAGNGTVFSDDEHNSREESIWGMSNDESNPEAVPPQDSISTRSKIPPRVPTNTNASLKASEDNANITDGARNGTHTCSKRATDDEFVAFTPLGVQREHHLRSDSSNHCEVRCAVAAVTIPNHNTAATATSHPSIIASSTSNSVTAGDLVDGKGGYLSQMNATIRRQFIQKRRAYVSWCLEVSLPIVFTLGLLVVALLANITEVPAKNFSRSDTPPLPFGKLVRLNLICYDYNNPNTSPELKQLMGYCDNSVFQNTGIQPSDDVRAVGLAIRGDYTTAAAFALTVLDSEFDVEIPNLDDYLLFKWAASTALRAPGSIFIERISRAYQPGKIYIAAADQNISMAFHEYMNATHSLYKYAFGGFFSSRKEAMPFVKSVANEGKVWALIEIHELTPKRIRYSLSMNSSATPMMMTGTTARFASGLGGREYAGYAVSGALTLQKAINDFHEQVSRGVATKRGIHSPPLSPSSHLVLTPMPLAKHTLNSFLETATLMGPFLLVLSYLYTVSQLAKRLVEEKELRLREGTMIMGLGKLAFFTSWLFFYYMQMIFTSLVVAVIMKFGITKRADFLVIWSTFLLFSLSSVNMAALLSTFFSKAKLAALCVPLLYFLLGIPGFAMPSTVSPAVYHALSIFCPSPFANALIILFNHEINEGLGWPIALDPKDKPYHFGFCIFWLIVDFFAYSVLLVYFDNVLPKQWGQRMHPCYCCCFICRACKEADAQLELESARGHHCGPDEEEFTNIFTNGPTQCAQPLDNPRSQMAKAPTGGVLEDYPRPNCEASVHINQLVKIFRQGKARAVAVNKMELRMFPDSITVLLGHNGAGKTTLMNIITGMMNPSSGDVTVYGKSILHELQAIRRDIGFCPQHNILWDDLTCMEHLLYFARLKGFSGADAGEEANEMLRRVDLLEKKDAYSKTLSGGQKRKLSVAIAFMGKARLVLLDEPTAGMDVSARRHTWGVLKEMARNGRTIILSTHYMDEADLLGDRVAIMSKGTLHSYGSPTFLKRHLGAGYALKLLMRNNVIGEDDVKAIVREVISVIPNAKLRQAKGQEISIALPGGAAVDLYPSAIRHLGSPIIKESLGIISVSISLSGLEEVFLAIAKQEETDGKTPEALAAEENVRQSSYVTLEQVYVNLLKNTHNSNHKKHPADIQNKLPSTTSEPNNNVPRTAFHMYAHDNDEGFTSLPNEEIFTTSPQNAPDHFVAEEETASAIVSVGSCESYSSAEGGERVPTRNSSTLSPVDTTVVTAAELGTATFSSRRRQFNGMFMKRFHHGRRDYCALSLQIVAPLVCILLAMGLSKIKSPQPQEFFWDNDGLYAADDDDHVTATNNCPFLDPFWDTDFAAVTTKTYPTTYNFSGYLLDSFGMHGSASRMVSFSCNDTFGNNVVFANATGVASAPQGINQLYRAKLRAFHGDPSATIIASQHPFPFSERQETQINTIRAVLMALFILVPFTFVPSTYVSFVVRERQSKAKHLQFVSGAGYAPYWAANFVYDLASYLVTVVIAFLLFMSFDQQWIVGDGFTAAGAIVLFVVYGVSVIGFAYLVSFLFSNHSTAQTVVMLVNFIVGFFLVLLMFFLRNIETTKRVAGILVFLFRIAPPFALGDSLFEMVMADAMRPVNGAKHAFNLDVAGYSMIYMAGFAAVFLLSTMIIDHPSRSRRQELLNFRSGQSAPHPSESDEEEEDDDVKFERLAVEANLLRSDDVIQVKGLRKEYASHEIRPAAVKHLTFGVKRGEVFGFLGTNGAGKTTTMSMLTTEIIPTCGRASIGGYDIVKESEEARRLIGYCPQFDAIMDLLTPSEHLALFAALRGIAAVHSAEVIDALINSCGLQKYRDVPAGRLSGGNKRKLSVAMALIGGPSIVFLDEPSAGMDPHTRRQMWGVINFVAKHSSVVLTTHHLEEVDVLAHRVGIMDRGALRCLGTLEHLKQKFGNGFELTFIFGRVNSPSTTTSMTVNPNGKNTTNQHEIYQPSEKEINQNGNQHRSKINTGIPEEDKVIKHYSFDDNKNNNIINSTPTSVPPNDEEEKRRNSHNHDANRSAKTLSCLPQKCIQIILDHFPSAVVVESHLQRLVLSLSFGNSDPSTDLAALLEKVESLKKSFVYGCVASNSTPAPLTSTPRQMAPVYDDQKVEDKDNDDIFDDALPKIVIEDYTIQQTSLEQVFLRISEMGKKKAN